MIFLVSIYRRFVDVIDAVKKKKVAPVLLLAGTVLAVALAVVCAANAGSDSGPGTAGDPLVTKSYVDWKVVELKAGQVLVAGAGAEFLPRRGQLTAVDPTGNGIPDVTAGADLFAGERVPLNHLLIFPRDDGRGVKALANSWVMYRGTAEVK